MSVLVMSVILNKKNLVNAPEVAASMLTVTAKFNLQSNIYIYHPRLNIK